MQLKKHDRVEIVKGPWRGRSGTVVNPAYGCQGQNLLVSIQGYLTIIYRDEVVAADLAHSTH